jgi:hypothetical protein
VEQHKPYLVWICLSVHNRSHSGTPLTKKGAGRTSEAGGTPEIWWHHPIRHRFRLINARAWPTDVSLIAQHSTPDRVHYAEHPERVMTSHSGDVPSVSDICAHVKHLGYAISRRIRLYGEEVEVVSDSFPEAVGLQFT